MVWYFILLILYLYLHLNDFQKPISRTIYITSMLSFSAWFPLITPNNFIMILMLFVIPNLNLLYSCTKSWIVLIVLFSVISLLVFDFSSIILKIENKFGNFIVNSNTIFDYCINKFLRELKNIEDSKEAFENLKIKSSYLKETNFNEIISYGVKRYKI